MNLFDKNVQHIELAGLNQFKVDARNREEAILLKHGDNFRCGDSRQKSFHEQAENKIRQLPVKMSSGFDEAHTENFKIAARFAEAEDSRAVPENLYKHYCFVV